MEHKVTGPQDTALEIIHKIIRRVNRSLKWFHSQVGPQSMKKFHPKKTVNIFVQQ